MRRGIAVVAWGLWMAGALGVARMGWIWATTPAPPGPLTAWDWAVRGLGAVLLWVGVLAVSVPFQAGRR